MFQQNAESLLTLKTTVESWVGHSTQTELYFKHFLFLKPQHQNYRKIPPIIITSQALHVTNTNRKKWKPSESIFLFFFASKCFETVKSEPRIGNFDQYDKGLGFIWSVFLFLTVPATSKISAIYSVISFFRNISSNIDGHETRRSFVWFLKPNKSKMEHSLFIETTFYLKNVRTFL